MVSNDLNLLINAALEGFKITFYLIVVGFFYTGFFGLLFSGMNRKIIARMQKRVGPSIYQEFYDFLKLCGKESIVPKMAIGWLFNFAPILSLASLIAIMLYIPIGIVHPFSQFGDVISIIYLLTMAAIAKIIGGASSASMFGTLGAQRELVMIVAYKGPMALVLFSLAWRISGLVELPFLLTSFSQVNIWLMDGLLTFIGVFLLLIVFMACIPGKSGVGLFDLNKAKQELAYGSSVEYSGRNLALYKLSDAMLLIVMSGLCIAIFFPFRLSEIIGIQEGFGILLDFVAHLVKSFIVVFFSISLVDVMSGRLKIDQAVGFYWFVLIPIALIGLIFISIDYLFV
ncbi:MAG: NADH-quinone oxidoreductase subunit H [Methanosarcinaceae archaeon]|nr:NADH-quinone oxidoreductase subunit H [Methanosarcinaceae archaeon]